MDNLTKAIARLIELTQKGMIRWERIEPPDLKATDEYTEIAFGTEYDGERLRVFRRRSKVAIDEDRLAWSENPVVQIIDAAGRTLYEFPITPATYDLIDTVQYQVSGVGPWIDKLASGD